MIDYDRTGLAQIEEIADVEKHPNADRLDIVTVRGWKCIARKDAYKKGDPCVFFEIDAILPEDVESKIFGPDAKVKLSKSRVKTTRIRGYVSQGLTCPLNILFTEKEMANLDFGDDVTKTLGVGKYVPTPKKSSVLYVAGVSKKFENENFKKMRKPQHYKRVGAFGEDQVYITEKIHGTSFVCGWVERESRTWRQRLVKRFFGDYQFCWRSMNCQLQGSDSFWTNLKDRLPFFKKEKKLEKTLYGRIAKKYNLKDALAPGDIITGEIYGWGVQTNYDYGCAEGEQRFVMFGLRKNGVEQRPAIAKIYSVKKGIPFVPILYVGVANDDIIANCTCGPSVLDPSTKVREGCVINSANGESGIHGSALVKSINPEYSLGEQSEFN